jgi:hypothetical protein
VVWGNSSVDENVSWANSAGDEEESYGDDTAEIESFDPAVWEDLFETEPLTPSAPLPGGGQQ